MTDSLRMILTGVAATVVLVACIVGGVLVLSIYRQTPRGRDRRRRVDSSMHHPPGWCDRCQRTYVSATDITRAINQGAIPDEYIYQPN